jgi:hypothetical protein
MMVAQLGVHSGHHQLHCPQVPEDEDKKRHLTMLDY